MPRRTQRQRAVRVADHDDVARRGAGARGGRLVEDQPVRGIRGDEALALDVGPASQRVERETHGASA